MAERLRSGMTGLGAACRLLAWAISLLVAGLGSACANTAGGGGQGSDVTLAQRGDLVVLDNGIVAATVDPRAARVVSLRYRGQEMVQTRGQRRDVYFSMSGGASYEQPAHCVYSVTTQRPDQVDISCKRVYSPALGDKQAWDLDIHFVLRRGASGLYSYALVSHPASYPTVGMGEWRMVWWMPTQGDRYLLERIYVDEKRHWLMPSPADLAHAEATPIKEIVRLTIGPWAGKYDCKYAYNAEYYRVGTYGHASDASHLGAWVVLGGYDYFNDGPLKQDLAPASGIIHLHLYENHYGARGFTIQHGQEWKKIYGPWLLYCNSKPSADECWADAKAQVQAERAAWPYTWLSNAEYPPDSQRGSVSGRFTVRDSLKPAVSGAGAWVGLALPEETAGNWQFQGSAYQYWVQAGPEGSFTIPHVRPGSYTLYAFTTGAVGEFSEKNVAVTGGKVTALGDVLWTVPHAGKKIAWEIGVPDRHSTEFGDGSVFYQPYLYRQFPQQYSNPLDYDVAKQNWSTAWNYAQNPYPQGAVGAPWKWRIHFNLDTAPAGDSTLTIAFAGSQAARVEVYANDDARPVSTFAPPNQGGNALLREGDHAKYGVSYVTIPAGHLKQGANTITLVQASDRGEGNHVMYDYLDLETP